MLAEYALIRAALKEDEVLDSEAGASAKTRLPDCFAPPRLYAASTVVLPM